MYKKILKIPLYLIFNFIYFLSFLIKKDEKVWLFGAWFGDKYSDNSKALYKFILKYHKDYKIYWITKNKQVYKKLIEYNLPVLYMFSMKGIFYTLKAKVVIMSNSFRDINLPFLINRKKTLKIQLWHGVGNKRIGFNTKNEYAGTKFYNVKKYFFPFLDDYWYDMVLATSELMQERFSTSFKLPKEKVPILGYPRNDIFFKLHVIPRKIFNILYAPTHRKQGKNDLSYLPTVEDLENINKLCNRLNAKFFMKLHYYDEDKMKDVDFKKFQNIILLNSNPFFDMQKQLLITDILITDYSSIYFDYLLLDRPVIFSAFDLEEYEKEDQGIYEPLRKIAAGPICNHWNEVLIWVEKFKKDPTLYAKERKKVRDKFHKYQDGKSCERVYQEIKRLLNE